MKPLTKKLIHIYYAGILTATLIPSIALALWWHVILGLSLFVLFFGVASLIGFGYILYNVKKWEKIK